MNLQFPKTWKAPESQLFCGMLVRNKDSIEILPPPAKQQIGRSTDRVISWPSRIPPKSKTFEVVHRDTGEISTVKMEHPFMAGNEIMAPVPVSGTVDGKWEYNNHGMRIMDCGMLDVLLTLMQYGATEAPTHIYGETGVGKEGLARLVHSSSSRSTGPLIFINCGALHRDLGHGELFGREKGSYTGATHEAPGLIERAHGGTLFLDEVGELSLDDQARLLRVLETGTIRRLGAGRERKVDVRIVSATHADLRESVQAGKFREDLYYRLCVLECRVPPLRERPGDLSILPRHFLREFGHSGKIQEDAMRQIMDFSWPGNIRQLRNIVYKAAISAGEGNIRTKHLNLPPQLSDETRSRDLQLHIDNHIRRELFRQRGNRKRTCDSLSISRSTLYRWLRRNPSLIRPGEELQETREDEFCQIMQ